MTSRAAWRLLSASVGIVLFTWTSQREEYEVMLIPGQAWVVLKFVGVGCLGGSRFPTRFMQESRCNIYNFRISIIWSARINIWILLSLRVPWLSGYSDDIFIMRNMCIFVLRSSIIGLVPCCLRIRRTAKLPGVCHNVTMVENAVTSHFWNFIFKLSKKIIWNLSKKWRLVMCNTQNCKFDVFLLSRSKAWYVWYSDQA